MKKDRVIYLIGGKGRLGMSITKVFGNSNLVSLDRKEYQDWFRSESINDIQSVLNISSESSSNTIMILSGIMDPSEDKELINKVNFQLPKNIIKACEGTTSKIVTFGSVMEDLSPEVNHYIASKNKLSEFINSTSVDVLSVKIHTLYGGGAPNTYMFLGQLLDSIINKTEFKMSSGNQLREYHHVDDDSKAIMELLRQNITGKELISHGEAISLKELATSIFTEFDMLDKLRIGACEDRNKENYNIKYSKNINLNTLSFRNSIAGIISYLKFFTKHH
jgi:nucleoside-diphosphate-sugar epimerase